MRKGRYRTYVYLYISVHSLSFSPFSCLLRLRTYQCARTECPSSLPWTSGKSRWKQWPSRSRTSWRIHWRHQGRHRKVGRWRTGVRVCCSSSLWFSPFFLSFFLGAVVNDEGMQTQQQNVEICSSPTHFLQAKLAVQLEWNGHDGQNMQGVLILYSMHTQKT